MSLWVRVLVWSLILRSFYIQPSQLRAAEAHNEPTYVGARVCAECHTGPASGNQYSLWLASKHSQSYAALTKPEAEQIARLSGARQEPEATVHCLSCHSSAANAEPRQRQRTYRIEDGVQCETCHGPGSEHVARQRAGTRSPCCREELRRPTKQLCLRCHLQQTSHAVVLKARAFDLEQAWREIAHPRPTGWQMGGIPELPASGGNQHPGPKYVGAYTCGQCHRGARFNHQYSRWRRSPHARAWAVLGTPRAREIAREEGVDGDPQRDPRCLRCHTTVGTAPRQLVASTYEIDEGVGCEACHGPGSDYMTETIMRDRQAARRNGLREVSKEVCKSCHENAHAKAPRAGLSSPALPSNIQWAQ